MSKVIFSGLESSGKSLQLARIAEKVLFRNASWKKKSGIARPIVFNFPVNQAFKDTAEQLGVPLRFLIPMTYDDLVAQRDCDIFIDEIGTYFDSRLWTDLSLDVRRWVAQGAKMGIELYAAAQDFSQVDISFRRLTNELYYISKWFGSPRPAATKPPVKFIWGICAMWEMNPQHYDEKKKEFVFDGFLPIPKFFFIRRHDCELFDTKFFIERSPLPVLRHGEQFCEYDHCPIHGANDGKPKYTHR